MTVTVAHHSTQTAVVGTLDKAADQLLSGEANQNIQIVDPKKSWQGSVMTFSFTGKVGFIAVPLAGTVAVDDANVTVECDLPPMVKSFLGEEKIRSMVEENVRKLTA